MPWCDGVGGVGRDRKKFIRNIRIGGDHSESESLGGGERKETRKQYGSTISCIWGEAVHGMRILWRPYSQSYFWAEPPKIMLGQGVVSTT